jgi:hypothetical protein
MTPGLQGEGGVGRHKAERPLAYLAQKATK